MASARRRLSVVSAWILAAMIGLAPSLASGQRLPRGSFLRHYVANERELNREVSADPLLFQRFARLWGISPGMVRALIRRLHMTLLPRDRILRVYYVHPGEMLGYRIRLVRKGTRVFALPDGTPVLVAWCGNPLKIALPQPGSSTGLPPALFVPEYDLREEVTRETPIYVERPPEAPGEMLPTIVSELVPPEVPLGVPPGFIEDIYASPPGELPPPQGKPSAWPWLAPLIFLAWFGGFGPPFGPGAPPPGTLPPPGSGVPEPGAPAAALALVVAATLCGTGCRGFSARRAAGVRARSGEARIDQPRVRAGGPPG